MWKTTLRTQKSIFWINFFSKSWTNINNKRTLTDILESLLEDFQIQTENQCLDHWRGLDSQPSWLYFRNTESISCKLRHLNHFKSRFKFTHSRFKAKLDDLLIIIYSLIQICNFFFFYFFNHPKMTFKSNIICDHIQYTWFKFSPKSSSKVDPKFEPLNCCITILPAKFPGTQPHPDIFFVSLIPFPVFLLW